MEGFPTVPFPELVRNMDRLSIENLASVSPQFKHNREWVSALERHFGYIYRSPREIYTNIMKLNERESKIDAYEMLTYLYCPEDEIWIFQQQMYDDVEAKFMKYKKDAFIADFYEFKYRIDQDIQVEGYIKIADPEFEHVIKDTPKHRDWISKIYDKNMEAKRAEEAAMLDLVQKAILPSDSDEETELP